MKRQRNRKNIDKKQGSLPFPYYILMMPVVMGFLLPLIMRGHSYEVPAVFQKVSVAKGGYGLDVFLLGKQIWLFWAVGVALFLFLCFKLLERKIVYYERWMVFGGIYLLCAFISSLMAADIKTAFFGGEDLFQGFLVILSYFILFYYTYMIFCSEKKQRLKLVIMFFRCVLLIATFMIILGLFQVWGNDPFSWEWLQELCGMKGAQIVADKRIYLTLYNSNYVGVMTILLLPLLFTGMLVEKNKAIKVSFGVATIGIFGCLIASGSKTAIIVLIILVALASAIAIFCNKPYRKAASIVLVMLLLACATVLFATKGSVLQVKQPFQKQKCILTGMSTEDNSLKLEIEEQELSITWKGDEIRFTDENGTVYETEKLSEKKRKKLMKKLPEAMISYYGEGQFIPEKVVGAPFDNIYFFKSGLQNNGKNIRGYVFYINKQPFFITNEWKNGEYSYYNLSGSFVSIYNSEDAFDEEIYGLASYRGYIWSKTIPNIKKTVLTGVGMNHFSLLFPNDDYGAKARIDKLGVTYNKPHSWYLQMGTESGLIALLCMIIMLSYILKEGIKQMKTVKSDFTNSYDKCLLKSLLIGSGVSICGYCLINVLYDEMIVTAPVFWIILGAYAGISKCFKEE